MLRTFPSYQVTGYSYKNDIDPDAADSSLKRDKGEKETQHTQYRSMTTHLCYMDTPHSTAIKISREQIEGTYTPMLALHCCFLEQPSVFFDTDRPITHTQTLSF